MLDASRILAGPFAAQILGEYGAEVLKIEPPSGDDTRHWGPPFQGPQSAYFQSCNRNKSSLVLDLEKASDRTRFNQLLAKADIYLDNFLPHSQSKWGVDEARLNRQFPRLVHGHISSFPVGHARAEEKGYDLALQAETGWIALNGAPDDPVGSKVGVAVLDVLSGQMLANALLAGLVKRLRTGQGCGVSVSLVQTALYCLVNVASNALVSGKPSQRWGNAHANIVPYQDFACRDGRLVLAIGNDRQFQSFCGVMGLGKNPISQ
ncbi:MAG: CoA transferase, partial [Acidobacteria bacterium]|nr:CoA transferase [Acidobacteriota bacterium]